jgi:hypothetical protein
VKPLASSHSPQIRVFLLPRSFGGRERDLDAMVRRRIEIVKAYAVCDVTLALLLPTTD